MSEQTRERATYVIGFGLAALLTAIAFGALLSGWFSPAHALLAIGIAGVLQLLVHLRFFLHIDLSRQKREDLQLILFSALLLAIMVGGTMWIMGNLAAHMS